MAPDGVEVGRSATVAGATLTLVNWDWLPFNPFPSEMTRDPFGVERSLLVEFEMQGGPEVDLLRQSFEVAVAARDAAGQTYPGSLPDYAPGPGVGRVWYAFANAPRVAGLVVRMGHQGQSVSFQVGDPAAPLGQPFTRRDELLEAWIAAQLDVAGSVSQPTLRAVAQATRAALALRGDGTPGLGPATPTTAPIALVTEQYLANGIERTRYHFADPNDVLPAREAILRVLDILSLRDGLPEPDVLNERLRAGMLDVEDPGACTYRGVLDLIASRRAANEYVRWTTFEVVKWQDAQEVSLDIGDGLTVDIDIEVRANAERVDSVTRSPTATILLTISGGAQVRYVDGHWLVTYIDVYCRAYDPVRWP
jgi:hypothetical protein